MKKFLSIPLLVFFAVAGVYAQEFPKWKNSGVLTWGYNQTAVSDNWTGKETFSRSWQLSLSLVFEREGEKTNWYNSFKEMYGEGDSDAQHSILKDMFEFNTVWSYKVYKYLQPYASFYVLTQNNKFWDPVTYVESAGLSFTLLNNSINTLKVRAGGALKQVDDSKNGDTRDSGAEAIINYSLLFHKTARFVSEARIYETFKNGEDIKWDNKLFLKTGPWFTTEFGYIMYFDNSRISAHSWPNDIEHMTYVSIGLSFNLFN